MKSALLSTSHTAGFTPSSRFLPDEPGLCCVLLAEDASASGRERPAEDGRALAEPGRDLAGADGLSARSGRGRVRAGISKISGSLSFEDALFATGCVASGILPGRLSTAAGGDAAGGGLYAGDAFGGDIFAGDISPLDVAMIGFSSFWGNASVTGFASALGASVGSVATGLLDRHPIADD